MSDGEIEFLGSKAPFTPALQRPVTGIVLHVEKNGPDSEAYGLTFHRSSSSVIHVGRRPGAESESRTRDIDSGRAMFRCAVVSRKHAKIAFSDSGHVYVIDLSSHHGTHVRKSGELWSKPVPPEVPFPLNDGDLVTFGKTVGRNEECVNPIVVRIELLRGTQPIKPLIVPTTPSDKSSSSSSSKYSSGRYGVYYSSDERPSSPLNDESDFESQSPVKSVGEALASQGSQQDFSSGIGRAFDLLKRLIPPSHTPNSLQLPPIVPPEDRLGFHFDDPQWGVTSLPSGSEPERIEKSRSHSPMDLESPSPAPAPLLPLVTVDSMPGELSPSPKASRQGSPEAGTSEHLEEHSSSESEDDGEGSENDEARPTSLSPEPAVSTVEPASEPNQDDIAQLKRTVEFLEAEVSRLDTHRRKYRTRFNNNVHRIAEKLSHYDDRLAEVNAQSDNLAEKVETISRIELSDINCQLEEMNDQVENLAYVDVPDMQTRIDALEDDVSAIKAKAKEDSNEAQALHQIIKDMKQLQATTEAQIQESLNEVKELCKNTIQQVLAEHKLARDAIANASAIAAKEVRLRAPPFPPTMRAHESLPFPSAYLHLQSSSSSSSGITPSLKRKRDLEDDGELEEDVSPASGGVFTPEDDSESDVEGNYPVDDTMFNEGSLLEGVHRPKKKLRTVAKVVARTATAVTLGAVATWGVLAFA